MTDREKLVGIMGENPIVFCDCCGEDYLQNKMLLLADHLIANGVTVQEWISVEDRLPDDMPPERYMPICMAMIDQADELVLLGSWLASPGAQLARDYAAYQRKPVRELKELCGK